MEEQNNKRTKLINLRLNPNEHQKIFHEFSQSICRNISEYTRKKLLSKPITTKYRNQSLDDFMEETIALRNELNAIGNNLNQLVQKLNTLQHVPEFRDWIVRYELEKTILFNTVEDIKKHIQKIAEQWLQP
jgi:uncharacterized protein YbgA (DUF1722 family)